MRLRPSLVRSLAELALSVALFVIAIRLDNTPVAVLAATFNYASRKSLEDYREGRP